MTAEFGSEPRVTLEIYLEEHPGVGDQERKMLRTFAKSGDILQCSVDAWDLFRKAIQAGVDQRLVETKKARERKQ